MNLILVQIHELLLHLQIFKIFDTPNIYAKYQELNKWVPTN